MASYIPVVEALEFIPNESVGPIRFYVSRKENRVHFDTPRKTYAQSDGELPHDTYESLGLIVMYDKYNTCGAVEVGAPCKPVYQGKDLLNMPYSAARKWLVGLDKGARESEKDLISFDIGIALFAPEKGEDPDKPCESVTFFRKDWFNRKIGIPDPAIFPSFRLQAGFVEGIEESRRTYPDLRAAFTDLFCRNKESAIILWNSLPLRWSYVEDIPALADGLIECLEFVLSGKDGETSHATWETPNVSAEWSLQIDGRLVSIHSKWHRLPGGLDQALNKVGHLLMRRDEFLSEWKLLLTQMTKALQDGKVKMEDQKAETSMVRRLARLDKAIEKRGFFYRYEERST